MKTGLPILKSRQPVTVTFRQRRAIKHTAVQLAYFLVRQPELRSCCLDILQRTSNSHFPGLKNTIRRQTQFRHRFEAVNQRNVRQIHL
jgi:hypothetical protein